MDEFTASNKELLHLVDIWEPKLSALSEEVITTRRNSQNRSIKEIVGHMVDSASNNTHRIVHLQYQPSPLVFPDYANLGNNDRWIAVQNYREEPWHDLVQLWKYANLHIVHVIRNVNHEKLGNEWITALNTSISLEAMIINYLKHFKLHLGEIEALINDKTPNMKFKSVDEYLSIVPGKVGDKMQELRMAIRQAVPEAEELISYNMPAFRFHGILVYYAAHKEHIGFYPGTRMVNQVFKNELEKFDTSKGTIKFPYDEKLPLRLIKNIVKFRAKENLERDAVKMKKKK